MYKSETKDDVEDLGEQGNLMIALTQVVRPMMIHKLMHRNNLTKMITMTVHTQVTIHPPSSQMTKMRILMII